MVTQVDRINGLVGSIALKAPCRAATTENITLAGEQIIDGVVVVTDDRVLVKDQSSSIENGVYNVSTTSWTRAADFNGERDIVKGTMVRVNEGSISASISYEVSSSGTTIGVSPITFSVVDFPPSSANFDQFNSKSLAAATAYTSVNAGQKVFITSSDGGSTPFTVRYNATPGTYADDGGTSCGTVFIPTGGDGTIGIERDIEQDIWSQWFNMVGDDSTDNTTQGQFWLNACKANNKTPRLNNGIFQTAELSMVSISDMEIIGSLNSHLKLIHSNYGAITSIFDISGCNKLHFKGITFVGTSDTLVTYDAVNRYAGLYVSSSSFIEVSHCEFTKFSSYGIFATSLSGGTYTEGMKIHHNIFRDSPYSSLTAFQCGILLSTDAEYSYVDHNEFYRIPSAIRFTDGANSSFTHNIVMQCNGGDDTVKTDRACVYAEYNAASNSGKLTIAHNRINHNETGQVPMILKGDPAKAQNAFIVESNDMLVNGGTLVNYGLIMYDAPHSRVFGNQIRPLNSTHPLIQLTDSSDVATDLNYLNGGTYGISLTGTSSDLKVGAGNIFKNQATAKINGTAWIYGGRRDWIVRFVNTTKGTPNETPSGWVLTNPAAGQYTLTHDIGDTNFIALTSADNDVGDTTVSTVRSTTDMKMYVWKAGVATSTAVMLQVTLPANHEYLL